MIKNIIILGIILLVFVVGCTEIPLEKNVEICTADYTPVCGVDEITYSNECSAGEVEIAYTGECNSDENDCEALGGNWIDGVNECEGISKDTCEEFNGVFDECASACRNTDTRICTLQCVQVCTFPDHFCTDTQKENQACTREYIPVCGADGQTYGNKCTACSSGVDYYNEGEC